MLGIEMWILKNKYRLMAALVLLIIAIVNPYKIYEENELRVLNEKRMIVESEFKKTAVERNDDLLKKNLSEIERKNKRLFMVMLVNNSFKTNEYKSLKINDEIYKSIKNKAIRVIVELEIAIEDKDLAKLEELYGEVNDKNLKDYILYVIKNIDPENKIEFEKDSVIKNLYIG